MGTANFHRIKTILLVEDDVDVREMLELLLDSLDLKYKSVADGAIATEVLAAEKIDVLITDFRMPRMDGVQLLDWCRSRQMHLPVIFLSANAELISAERIALNDCCATLMKKPIILDALIDALQAADQLIHHPNCVHERHRPV